MSPIKSKPSRQTIEGCLRFFKFRSAILAIAILSLMPVCLVHATDYAYLGLGKMVERSDLIIVAKLTPSGKKLETKVEEVLKGNLPQGFELSGGINSYRSSQEGGKEIHYGGFGGDTRVTLDDPTSSIQRILFLRIGPNGEAQTFHPACIEEVEKKQRVMEILAMAKDPAPFVISRKYAEDVDLIFSLGIRFYAFRILAPAVPELEKHSAAGREIPEEMPWQHISLKLSFNYEPSRKPMLEMTPFDAKGPIPDFIRKCEGFGVFDSLIKETKVKLPPTFSVTLDTNGPAQVGGLTYAATAAYLRKQLESEKLEVIKASYEALEKLMDSDSVPIAIEMLKHPDRKFRSEAAIFLSYAKDPRSVEPIIKALDELPPCIRYAEPSYNQEDDELGTSLGRVVLNLSDPRTIPALKRAALKGYAGDWLAITLSRLGDESAFEPLLSHWRNPNVNHYGNELVMLIKRSNMKVEPWMEESLWSDDRAGKLRQASQWLEWWEKHKAEFRVIRTWEESIRGAGR
jgi:hypothetical protein